MDLFLHIYNFQAVDEDVKKEIDKAVERAKVDKELPLEELYKDIYSGGMQGHPVRGCDPMTIVQHNWREEGVLRGENGWT